jgi:hypothetical protein
MNKYKTYTGVQTDVTWDDLLYTPEANRAFIHAYGKAVSGDTDMILQGCVFTVSTGLGTNATITAGYVYDQTSGEVVRVEAQTVVETLGNDTWELVKTTTYDAAGDNVYRDLATKQNYQQERMVLTNVAAITNFDVEPKVRPIVKTYFNIGDWDMDATAGVTVDNPLTGIDEDNIISVKASILDDSGGEVYDLVQDGYIRYNGSMGSDKFNLYRTAAGFFDGVNFNSTSFNRGFIIVEYVV